MDEFHNETASTFTIEDCQFGPNDCRDLWYPQMTYFGKCLQFSTFNVDREWLNLGRKEIQMSVVASYNISGLSIFDYLSRPICLSVDWTYGWVSMLDGFSIFVNSEMEETLDDALTLLSGDKTLMQIDLRQENSLVI